MSKPLTIEELKSLKEGDWVWVVCPWNEELTQYARIEKRFNSSICGQDTFLSGEYVHIFLSDCDYGTRWLAYKNKEQAEGKVKQVRKEVAKEILTTLTKWNDRDTPLKADIQELAEKYGVEVDE